MGWAAWARIAASPRNHCNSNRLNEGRARTPSGPRVDPTNDAPATSNDTKQGLIGRVAAGTVG